MLECMKNRRSIRKYTDQDIPESLLNELLEPLLVIWPMLMQVSAMHSWVNMKMQ